MTRTRITDRFMALALLVAAIGLFAAFVIFPALRTADGLRTEIAERLSLIARAEGRAVAYDDLVETVADEQKVLAAAPGLLPTEAPDLAGARLQERVRNIVTAAGGLPSRSDVGDLIEDGAFLGVPARVTFLGDAQTLRDVLHEIEFATPDLTVTDLSIRADTEPGMVVVMVETTGWLLPEADRQ